MASGTYTKPPQVLIQTGTVNHTRTSGANWSFTSVTFPNAYKSIPFVNVMKYDCGTATGDEPPTVRWISKTGFQFGWWSGSGTNSYIWEAIGVV